MKTVKTVKSSVRFKPDEYVNINTGETLLSEMQAAEERIKVTKDTDLITITSEEYMVIDSNAWKYMVTLINNVDRDRVHLMGDTLKTDFNIVFNHNTPYTEEKLAEFLVLHIKKFRQFINRLFKHNILAYTICAPSGFIQKIFMLNPTIVRKRKTFNKDLLNYFSNFSTKK